MTMLNDGVMTEFVRADMMNDNVYTRIIKKKANNFENLKIVLKWLIIYDIITRKRYFEHKRGKAVRQSELIWTSLFFTVNTNQRAISRKR